MTCGEKEFYGKIFKFLIINLLYKFLIIKKAWMIFLKSFDSNLVKYNDLLPDFYCFDVCLK